MHASAYMQIVEEVVEKPDRLDALEASAGVDPDLDDTQREQVLERIGQYKADVAGKAAADELGEAGPDDDAAEAA